MPVASTLEADSGAVQVDEMASDLADDDLDGILDDALEAFEMPRKTTNAPSAKSQPESKSVLTKSPDEPQNADEAPPEVSVEAAKAFEDALKALGDLGLDQGEDGADLNDADMKLVEEFMTSLGGSLGGLGGSGANGSMAGGSDSQVPGSGQAAMPGTAGGAGLNKGGPPDVERLVESIVGHLLSEDVLKSPMLQMRSAYAEWLPKNAESLSAVELGRYSRQQELVEEICKQYESGADSSAVMELLSKMQETGAPPAAVMKGLSVDSDNSDGGSMNGMPPPELDKMIESCGVQ